MSVTAILGSDIETAADQIKCAIRLTKRLHTTLTGLLVQPDPTRRYAYVTGPETISLGNEAITAMLKAQADTYAALRAVFTAETKAAGSWLQSRLVRETAELDYRAAGEAMLSDAVVFPKAASNSQHDLNQSFDYALMQVRLPIVVAGNSEAEDKTCLIAWDGSPQAARAVRMHTPIIESYKTAIIAHNPNKLRESCVATGMSDPAVLADHLHALGLQTHTVALEGKTSTSLLKLAADFQAGVLVMGAYGHSRMGEMLFGGTTRAILSAKEAPALALMR